MAAGYDVSLLAGDANAQAFADGPGAQARFFNPFSLAMGAGGSYLYVADGNNSRVRKVNADTGEVSTLAGDGSCGGTASTFCYPMSVAFAGSHLYLSEQAGRIQRIDFSTNPVTITTIAGSYGGLTSNGSGTSAGFRDPRVITSNPAGTRLYVADFSDNLVRKIDLSTNPVTVTTLAGAINVTGTDDGAGWRDGTDSSTNIAKFNGPRGLAVDGAGYVYVADEASHTIRRIDESTNPATVITFAGLAGTAGSDDGTVTEARFLEPTGLLWVPASSPGHAGYLYVLAGLKVRRIDLSQSPATVTTVAGDGVYRSVDGPSLQASFTHLYSIATRSNGDLFVISGQSIRKLSPIP